VGCEHFYEYNARCQLTTWNPTPRGAAKVPGGPLDYAGKHWNGLIADYYQVRVERLTAQAIKDADAGRALNASAADLLQAQLAFDFQVSKKSFPTSPIGEPVSISAAIHDRYAPAFAACEA